MAKTAVQFQLHSFSSPHTLMANSNGNNPKSRRQQNMQWQCNKGVCFWCMKQGLSSKKLQSTIVMVSSRVGPSNLSRLRLCFCAIAPWVSRDVTPLDSLGSSRSAASGCNELCNDRPGRTFRFLFGSEGVYGSDYSSCPTGTRTCWADAPVFRTVRTVRTYLSPDAYRVYVFT
jgi:hypothetical protein